MPLCVGRGHLAAKRASNSLDIGITATHQRNYLCLQRQIAASLRMIGAYVQLDGVDISS